MTNTSATSTSIKVTVIGGGAIGLSWAALFLANGLHVTINDPRPDIEQTTSDGLEQIRPTLAALGFHVTDLKANLNFEADLEKAVRDADVIQENAPENVEFKQGLYAKLEGFIKPATLILSSSSSIPASVSAQHMLKAENVLIGHPFNPPHLIPLVEIVPGERTSKEAIAKAISFYEFLGKSPILIEKEMPGFVANRLQAAIMQESVYLVKEGVVTMENLDKIVSSSIGLRWAAAGPFKTFTLGGGPGGLPHFLAHLGPALERIWPLLGTAKFDEATTQLLTEQVNNCYAKVPYQTLEKERDEQQLAILQALGK